MRLQNRVPGKTGRSRRLVSITLGLLVWLVIGLPWTVSSQFNNAPLDSTAPSPPYVKGLVVEAYWEAERPTRMEQTYLWHQSSRGDSWKAPGICRIGASDALTVTFQHGDGTCRLQSIADVTSVSTFHVLATDKARQAEDVSADDGEGQTAVQQFWHVYAPFVPRTYPPSSWQQGSGTQGLMVHSVAGCAADGKVIYAGTRGSGVYGSDDGGRTWASQPASAAGETVNWLAVQPDNCNVAYAATWGTGVIKTENGGGEWAPANDGLGDLFLYVLAIDPGDTQTLYAGTASHGVYKSTNGGGTWFPASNGLPAGALVDALTIQSISPTVPLSQSIVFAGTWGSGVYASLDGAASWLPANNGLGDLEVYALAVGSSSAQVIYAGTHEGGVYRGEMGGYSWVQDGLPGQAAYTVAVAEDGVAYAGTDGTSDGHAVYVRPMAGVWEPMEAQPGAPVVRNLALCGASLLAGTTDGVWWYGHNGQ